METSTHTLPHTHTPWDINMINVQKIRQTDKLVRAPTTLKSEGEVTSLSGADKREVRDNREKW